MVESYTGLARKCMSMSKSNPSLAAAFSLREYSQMKRRVPIERASSSQDIMVFEEIDRLGGNGARRQKQAEEYLKKKTIEDRVMLQEQKAEEQKKRGRRRELEAKRNRQKQEAEAKQCAEEERLHREKEYREDQERQATEHERLLKEQERQMWVARQPGTCGTCTGDGVCRNCEGKGEIYAVFLSKNVSKEAARNFGRKSQGCERCGGCAQNIVGKVKQGSGQCPDCNGRGKVWPAAAFEQKSARPKFRSSGFSNNQGDATPKAMASPKLFPRS